MKQHLPRKKSPRRSFRNSCGSTYTPFGPVSQKFEPGLLLVSSTRMSEERSRWRAWEFSRKPIRRPRRGEGSPKTQPRYIIGSRCFQVTRQPPQFTDCGLAAHATRVFTDCGTGIIFPVIPPHSSPHSSLTSSHDVTGFFLSSSNNVPHTHILCSIARFSHSSHPLAPPSPNTCTPMPTSFSLPSSNNVPHTHILRSIGRFSQLPPAIS